MSHKVDVIDGNVCIHIGTTPVADIYRHIEVMTPDEARAFVTDVTAAIESIAPVATEPIEPVMICRWLTQADIEKYGDRWMWYYSGFGGHIPTPVQAKQIDGKIVIQIVGTSLWRDSSECDERDYFTPIREIK